MLSMILVIAVSGCSPANPKLRNMSTQTRLNDNTNNRLMNDNTLNTNDGLNTNLNNRLNTNLNNGMVRDNNLMNNSTGMDNNMLGNGTNLNSGLNNNTNNSNMSSRANTIAKRIAALPEVSSASVLINGNTAIVGCDLKGNTNNNLSANLKQKIEAAVKVADKNIKQVSITADSSIHSRIKTMSTNVNNGSSMSSFARDIEDILKKITTPMR